MVQFITNPRFATQANTCEVGKKRRRFVGVTENHAQRVENVKTTNRRRFIRFRKEKHCRLEFERASPIYPLDWADVVACNDNSDKNSP